MRDAQPAARSLVWVRSRRHRMKLALILAGLAAVLLVCIWPNGAEPQSPHVIVETPRLARDAVAKLPSEHTDGRGLRRRQSKRHGKGRGGMGRGGGGGALARAASVTHQNQSSRASGPTPPLFAGLHARSPLPRPFAEHLVYMAANPENLPQKVKLARGAFFIGSAGGFASRELELDSMRKAAGWRSFDSPVLPSQLTSPVLTGNAWHWGTGKCPDECRTNGGVCSHDLGRCDCPRHRYGKSCEVLVQPAVARKHIFSGWCVYNDSQPFFCDKPLCIRDT